MIWTGYGLLKLNSINNDPPSRSEIVILVRWEDVTVRVRQRFRATEREWGLGIEGNLESARKVSYHIELL